MSAWVPVSASELAQLIEIETEEDGRLPLTSITLHFPGTTALKFFDPGSQAFSEVPMEEGSFLAPRGGWEVSTRFIAAVGPISDVKPEFKKVDIECKDMVLLGMKLDTTESQVKGYFKDVEVLQVHMRQSKDNLTKYAFIKFADGEVARVLGKQTHLINGTLCSLKGQIVEERSRKIYVSFHAESISAEDLRQHFTQFGEVEDVFIPSPWRHFAFVTFTSASVVQSFVGQKHQLRGVSLLLKKGEAPRRGNTTARFENFESSGCKRKVGSEGALVQTPVNTGIAHEVVLSTPSDERNVMRHLLKRREAPPSTQDVGGENTEQGRGCCEPNFKRIVPTRLVVENRNMVSPKSDGAQVMKRRATDSASREAENSVGGGYFFGDPCKLRKSDGSMRGKDRFGSSRGSLLKAEPMSGSWLEGRSSWWPISRCSRCLFAKCWCPPFSSPDPGALKTPGWLAPNPADQLWPMFQGTSIKRKWKDASDME